MVYAFQVHVSEREHMTAGLGGSGQHPQIASRPIGQGEDAVLAISGATGTEQRPCEPLAMLISRVAASVASPTAAASDASHPDSVDESALRRGSLNHLWSKMQKDISKAFSANNFLTHFDCDVVDVSETDWIQASVLIRTNGDAEFYHRTSDEPFATLTLPQSTVVGHLNKLMVQITDLTQTFVLLCEQSSFALIFSTLLAWSRLRPAGIGSKMWCPPVPELDQPDIDMLRCEVKAHFTVYNRQHSGWSQFVATLKRSGLVQLFDSISNAVYSLQIRNVLGARIKTVDPSVVDSSMVLLLFPDLGGPESVYLKFSDIDDFEDWVATLKSLSLQPIAAPLSRDPLLCVRWRRGLSVKIGSNKNENMPESNPRGSAKSRQQALDQGSSIYIAICLSRWVFARTFVCPTAQSANWDQKFDLPGPELTPDGNIAPKQLEFKLKQKGNLDSGEDDVTIGSCLISDIPRDGLWRTYDLSPARQSVSIAITLSETPVLDSSYYTKLYDWTSDIELKLAVRLIASMPSSLNTFLPIFSEIYRAQGRQVEWIQTLAAEEVKTLDIKSETVFREASLFTKAVEAILQAQGESTLKRTIGRFVRKLVAGTNESLELDPARTTAEKAAANASTMQHFLNYLWSLVQSEGPPTVCRPIFRHMKSELARMKLADETIDRLMGKAISSLLFLRFYVPALVNPQLFGLSSKAIEPGHRRTLVLVAKILQGFANRVKFGSKEMWLVPMNSFVELHESALNAWYANICDQEPEQPIERLSKELPFTSFMGQQITSPNLVDEWATFASLTRAVCTSYALQPSQNQLNSEVDGNTVSELTVSSSLEDTLTEPSVRDPLVGELIKECRAILAKQEELVANLEQTDPLEANLTAPPPELFLNGATMLFGTEKDNLEPRAQKSRPNGSFSSSVSRLGWLPKSMSSSDVSLETRAKPSSSVRKLTQMLRISKAPK